MGSTRTQHSLSHSLSFFSFLLLTPLFVFLHSTLVCSTEGRKEGTAMSWLSAEWKQELSSTAASQVRKKN